MPNIVKLSLIIVFYILNWKIIYTFYEWEERSSAMFSNGPQVHRSVIPKKKKAHEKGRCSPFSFNLSYSSKMIWLGKKYGKSESRRFSSRRAAMHSGTTVTLIATYFRPDIIYRTILLNSVSAPRFGFQKLIIIIISSNKTHPYGLSGPFLPLFTTAGVYFKYYAKHMHLYVYYPNVAGWRQVGKVVPIRWKL